MATREQLAAYVESGYQFLTEHGPALGLDIDAVDVSRLDMWATTWCVLGQAHVEYVGSPYTDALDRIEDAGHMDADGRRDWQTVHGFEFPEDTPSGDTVTVYATLRELWVERLTRDRERLMRCGCPVAIVIDEGHQAGCAQT